MKTLLLLITAFFLTATPVYAADASVAGQSALPVQTVYVEDERATLLKRYLTSHNSPMASEAEHFVSEADRLGLDWKLVAAIAGVESTFGKHVPANSYNGWGWGIFTGASDGIHFKNWADGITTVSEGLKHNYIDKGAETLDQIGARYAASPTWATKVRYFLGKIEAFKTEGVEDLEVTI